nr:methylglyoxal synthase [Devosia pacifica]
MMARIGLVAHDDKKAEMVEWAKRHSDRLCRHELFATGTTGGRIRDEAKLEVYLFKSGPLGGDQQLGARIADGGLDALVFFIDPLTALPHDVDVKALTRLATLYGTLFACNRATADAVLMALEAEKR